jgi:hypothetical protein
MAVDKERKWDAIMKTQTALGVALFLVIVE